MFCPWPTAENKAGPEVKIIVPGGSVPPVPPHNIRPPGGGVTLGGTATHFRRGAPHYRHDGGNQNQKRAGRR